MLLEIALAEYGVKEIPGPENNPRILEYSALTGLDWVQSEDTSWCGIFLAYCISQIPETLRPSWPKEKAATARRWLDHGFPVGLNKAKPGDIVIFWRESEDSWKGHCAIFLRYENDVIYCLGGNQGDSVCVQAWPFERLLGLRRYV